MFALRFQIDGVNLNGYFSLGNYLFENSLVTEVVIENIIKENNDIKSSRKRRLFKSNNVDKDYKNFLNNLPDEIKLMLEFEDEAN